MHSLQTFCDEYPNAYEIRIGLKGDNWDNGDQSTKTNSAITGEVFKGDLQVKYFWKYSE